MNIVGKLYSKDCIHCKNMKDAWDDMKKQVAGKVDVKDFEASDDFDAKLAKFNEEHGTNVAVKDGFPTIYKIHHKNVSYYNGGRTAKEFVQWALGTTGGKKKSKKNKSKKNKSRRQRK